MYEWKHTFLTAMLGKSYCANNVKIDCYFCPIVILGVTYLNNWEIRKDDRENTRYFAFQQYFDNY